MLLELAICGADDSVRAADGRSEVARLRRDEVSSRDHRSLCVTGRSAQVHDVFLAFDVFTHCTLHPPHDLAANDNTTAGPNNLADYLAKDLVGSFDSIRPLLGIALACAALLMSAQ